MSEPINSNPRVLEAWELPTRAPAKPAAAAAGGAHVVELAEFSLFADGAADGQGRGAGAGADGGADGAVPSPPELMADDGDDAEPLDAQEVFDLIASVSDPEHPLTLGQLAVVGLDRIFVTGADTPDAIGQVHVQITPTITHCSLATLIGLGIRVRLERSLPPRFRVKITVTPGSHQSEQQVNKQLNDKERVAAACENEQLLKVIAGMLATCT